MNPPENPRYNPTKWTVRDAWIGVGLALAPVTQFALLVIAYYVTPGAHEAGRNWTLRFIHLGALLLTLASLAISTRELFLTTGDAGDSVIQRRRFLAICGIALSAFMTLLVIGQAVPTFLLWTGAEP